MIKVDNGYPFAEPGQDTVPPLALWLIGLGIEMIWNRAFRPTDNAHPQLRGYCYSWPAVRSRRVPSAAVVRAEVPTDADGAIG